jgi:hypothetical protein
MKDLGWNISAPVSLTIVFCGFAILFGTDPRIVAKAVAIFVPIVAYVAFAIVTVMWAIKVGDVGLHQNMSFQSRFSCYHGMSVVLAIVLAAAGSFILFFAVHVKGMISGAA